MLSLANIPHKKGHNELNWTLPGLIPYLCVFYMSLAKEANKIKNNIKTSKL